MDSPFANKAFADEIGVTFPLLSDWGGRVSKLYGVYDERTGTSRRATFLIDKNGQVTHRQLDTEAIDPSRIIYACSLPSRD